MYWWAQPAEFQSSSSLPMNREIRLLVIDEPAEFGRQTVEVQDFKNFTDPRRGIHRVYLKVMQDKEKMSTFHQLDLETLGSWLVMLKAFPGDCWYIQSLAESDWKVSHIGGGHSWAMPTNKCGQGFNPMWRGTHIRKYWFQNGVG